MPASLLPRPNIPRVCLLFPDPPIIPAPPSSTFPCPYPARKSIVKPSLLPTRARNSGRGPMTCARARASWEKKDCFVFVRTPTCPGKESLPKRTVPEWKQKRMTARKQKKKRRMTKETNGQERPAASRRIPIYPTQRLYQTAAEACLAAVFHPTGSQPRRTLRRRPHRSRTGSYISAERVSSRPRT